MHRNLRGYGSRFKLSKYRCGRLFACSRPLASRLLACSRSLASRLPLVPRCRPASGPLEDVRTNRQLLLWRSIAARAPTSCIGPGSPHVPLHCCMCTDSLHCCTTSCIAARVPAPCIVVRVPTRPWPSCRTCTHGHLPPNNPLPTRSYFSLCRICTHGHLLPNNPLLTRSNCSLFRTCTHGHLLPNNPLLTRRMHCHAET